MPSVTPTQVALGTVDHSFTLQAIMEVQRSIGELTGSVNHLKESVDGHGDSLKSLQRVVWIATGGFIVGSAVLAFVLDKLWDRVMTVIQSIPPAS